MLVSLMWRILLKSKWISTLLNFDSVSLGSIWSYKLIPTVEVTVHQNEELSCPTKDLLVWPRYDLARVRSAF